MDDIHSFLYLGRKRKIAPPCIITNTLFPVQGITVLGVSSVALS